MRFGSVGSWVRFSGLAAVAAVVLYSVAAYAAGACGNCLITNLVMRSNGWVQIGTSLNMAPPTCGSTNNTFMVFDATSVRGQALLSMAQSAYMAGKHVDMAGTNTCSWAVSNIEELSSLTVHN